MVVQIDVKIFQTSKFILDYFSNLQCLKKACLHVHSSKKIKFNFINAFKFEAYDFQGIV